MYLKSKFSFLLVAWFVCSTSLFAGVLPIFRPDVPELLQFEVGDRRKDTLQKWVEETTSSVVGQFKQMTRSLLGESRFGSALLEFLLGAESNQELAREELERIEKKSENREPLTTQEVIKLEVLREEFQDPVNQMTEPPGCVTTQIPGMIVLAPGQELLVHLKQAVEQEAASGGASIEEIQEDLAQMWELATYRDSKKVTHLRNLVARLIGRVIDLRKPELQYDSELRTLGEYVASQLGRPEFDFVPTSLVLGVVILDAVLANSGQIELSRNAVLNLLLSSLYVSHSIMHRNSIWGNTMHPVTELICRPGLLFNTATRAQEIWTARVSGDPVEILMVGPQQRVSYEVDKQIGKGVYGTVFLTKKCDFAIKIMSIEGERPALEDLICELLRPVSEHVLPINAVHFERKSVHVISAYCQGGDLRKFIKTERTRNPQIARACLRQILEALAALGRNKVIHGDVKSQNILFLANGRLVLADFGLAYLNIAGISDQETVATPGYRSPESLFKIGPITPAVDVFSAAAVWWEMLTGCAFYTPLRGIPTQERLSSNQQAAMAVILGIPSQTSWPELYERWPNFEQIVNECLRKLNPVARSTAVETHRCVIEMLSKDALNLWKKMTAWNPAHRITASEALQHPYFKDPEAGGGAAAEQ